MVTMVVSISTISWETAMTSRARPRRLWPAFPARRYSAVTRPATDRVSDVTVMTAGSNVLAGHQERRVVVSVGDPVQVPLHPSDVVAPAVDRGAERGPRNRHVIRQDRRCHCCPPLNEESTTPTVAAVTVNGCLLIPVIRIPA